VRVDVAGEPGGGDLALVDSHVEAAAYRSSGAGAQGGRGDVAVARPVVLTLERAKRSSPGSRSADEFTASSPI